MDPKMDSGFLQPGETLEDHYDVLRDLLPEEVVGVIDQLLCYEVCVSIDIRAQVTNECRWHGIKDIHCHRHFSFPTTSTSSYGLNQKELLTHNFSVAFLQN